VIPAGYLYKKVATRPEWLGAAPIRDVYSLSGCISPNFADYVPFWKHNGYWLFDAPGDIETLARDAGIDLSGQTLFYYEMHELEFDGRSRGWSPLPPPADFPTSVVAPEARTLQGFDVATFSGHTAPECSPLSCNGLAAHLAVNAHCLFATFEEAREALERGAFDTAEPGPLRIVSVSTVGARAGVGGGA
jgi:hypothetical protein